MTKLQAGMTTQREGGMIATRRKPIGVGVITLLTLTGHIVGCGPSAGNASSSDSAIDTAPASAVADSSVQTTSCNPEEVGPLLVVDTTSLRREQGDFVGGDGVPGTATRFYADSVLRVAVVRYLGDTRRTSITYFFGDAETYAVYLVHDIYDPENFPKVAASVRQYFYVCDGGVAGDYWAEWEKPVRETATELMSRRTP